MNTLLIIAALFCVYKIISGIAAKQKEQERERQEEQRQAEAQRMRQEWREQQARSAAWVREQEARYREQAREQERQAKEQTRLAKEQERQAAVLERHEAEIRKAQFTASQALADIDFQKDRLADLESQLDYLLLLQAGTVPGSKEHDKYQKRIVTLHNQIHTAESKLNRAKFQHSEAERKLA